MKATSIIAAGSAALLTWLFIKKIQSTGGTSSMQTNPRHANHHLTNVFANAKKHSAPKNAW